jgi:5'-nucleotidase
MKKLYVDMDGVLCDFKGAAVKELTLNPDQKYPQSKWGFFLKLKELPDAIESIQKLEKYFDVWILTRPSFRNVNCYTEKAQWIWDHLGYRYVQKLILSPDKSIVKGDFLVDDTNNANQSEFEGEWIKFGSEKYPNWKKIVEYLMELK